MDPHRQSETLYTLPTYTHSGAQGIFLVALVGAGLDVGAALLAAGAYLARRWGYAAALGHPWLLAAAYPDRQRLGLAGGATAGLVLLALCGVARRLWRLSRHVGGGSAGAAAGGCHRSSASVRI